MSHTDPIADMLTRVRNAILAKRKEVSIPYSTIKLEIAEILKKEGYINSIKKVEGTTPQIVIDLKFNENESAIEGLRRISKPGRRIFARMDNIPKVRAGLGLAILSTSKGLMTGKQCTENNLGGEVLLYIW